MKDNFISKLLAELYLKAKDKDTGVIVLLLAEIVWRLKEIARLMKGKK